MQGLKEKSLVEETLDKVDKLKPIAEKLGATLAQLGLAWCVANEHCSTVIMGATKEHQVTLQDLGNLLCPDEAILWLNGPDVALLWLNGPDEALLW